MTHVRLKLSIAAVVLAGAVGYLAFAGVQKGWVYTLGVDQYLASPQQQSLRVRLCGRVGDEDFQVSKSGLTAKFLLKGEQQSIPVIYHGVIPDMFKAGAEVVVEGKRDPGGAGTFQSDLLMTKCASKYEEGQSPEGMPKIHPSIKHETSTPPTGATP
jgi:cytochrome c-type biogenesis protein CcmE